MQIKDYQRVLKAIQVALKDVDYNNKSDMKMRLKRFYPRLEKKKSRIRMIMYSCKSWWYLFWRQLNSANSNRLNNSKRNHKKKKPR